MTRRDVTRTEWTCDWNCNGPWRVKFVTGSVNDRAKLPPGWLQIWGGGKPGEGDPYPIHLCPDCAELYNDCKSGTSERGKRFRAAYKLFRDAEKAFIEPADKAEPEVGYPVEVPVAMPKPKPKRLDRVSA